MRPARFLALALAVTGLPAAAQQCGGDWQAFLQAVEREAASRGLSEPATERFLSGAERDPAVIRADRAQGIFTLAFTEFARRLISDYRLQTGARMAERHDATFDRIERDYGVSRGVLLAFWGFETDFGQVQGDYNTRDALLTLAHDCRRPDLFRPQVYAAIELTARGGMDPATTTGAWAGEIGQVQMLPEDILDNGVDADGDGVVDLKGSATDALVSGANMLRDLGWRPNEPWLQEVDVPAEMDWTRTGLDSPRPVAAWARAGVTPRRGSLPAGTMPAKLVLPQGRNGPAFLGYPNFDVFFEWNKSLVYVTTAAYFATRLEGAPVFDPGDPPPALGPEQIKALQRKLQARGHDTGGVDGILGAQTRAAVRAEQRRLGLPADAWPTRELLERL